METVKCVGGTIWYGMVETRAHVKASTEVSASHFLENLLKSEESQRAVPQCHHHVFEYYMYAGMKRKN